MENKNNFQNEWISLVDLPTADAGTLNPLSRSYLTLTLLQYGLFYGILVIGGAVFLWFMPEFRWPYGAMALSVLVLLAILRIVVSVLVFPTKAFAVRQHDVLYQQGVFFFNQTIVPVIRIQHVSLGQGPLEKFFGLAHLNIYTAGGAQADLSLRGLLYDEAEKIKNHLLQNTQLTENGAINNID